jgi:replicative DNA helicase
MSITSSGSGFVPDTEPPFGIDAPWAESSGLDGGFPGGGGGGGGRTPPQDNDAEQSVLGSMLLSKDAIADVVEAVRGSDFYRPVHETVFDVMVDLDGRGEPVDPITTTAELQRRGELARVGGAPYLHTLSASVPIAANAGYYAQIVREKAILRRLVEAGTRIAQLGYAGEGQVDDVVDRAQAEVYGVTDKRASEDYAPLSAIMESTLDEIEAINNRDGEMIGVPTGFADLDELTNGLHPGQMVIVAARPAMGKALALDTPLPTPTGWTTMGSVRVGDQVLDARGRPTRVVAATGVMHGRPCYEVVLSDGSSVVADAGHQWLTEPPASPDGGGVPTVVTTEELAAAEGALPAVRNAAPIRGADTGLAVPAYALGAWLGAAGAEDRHIPVGYLRAGESTRRELLTGLLDTAGTVGRQDGSVRVRVSGDRLAADVHELVVGLGYGCTPPDATRELTFTTVDDVFGVHDMAILHKELRPRVVEETLRRRVVAVRPVDSVPVRCVEVDNDEHLYLAGRAMVPTHNSTLGLDLCRSASIHHNMTSVIFSLEMTRNEITMRLLSAESKIPLNHMRNGNMNDDDWTRLARKMGEVSSSPLFIDDSPNMTMMEIRAKARRLKQRHGLRLIVIDYMQLMTSGKKVESRQLEVSEFSRQIKLLAKELEIPVVALSQLNRGSEQRADKRPMMSDLRESGSLEQDADMVILLHREDVYERESTRPGEADLIVAKHRNGPTRDLTVAFQGHYSRFVDMAHG